MKTKFSHAKVTFLGHIVSAKIEAISIIISSTYWSERPDEVFEDGWLLLEIFVIIFHRLQNLWLPFQRLVYTLFGQTGGVKMLLRKSSQFYVQSLFYWALTLINRLNSMWMLVHDIGLGAVLLQEDVEGQNHPICFFSKKFNCHQHNYCRKPWPWFYPFSTLKST